MELNIEAQKQEFLTICRASIQREGLEDLLAWLEKADFFTAPASTKYHGGVCRRPLPAFHRRVPVREEASVPDGQAAVGGVCGDRHPVP